MAALAAGRLLDGVRDLSLRNNKCGTEGGIALARARGLAHLRKLSLFYNWMGVKGARALLAATPNLEELRAEENNYGVEPSRFLAASTEMRSLRKVTLRQAEPGPLATSAAAQTFEELSLENSALDVAAARALAALPALELLHLSFVSLDDEARAVLRARFGPNVTAYGDFDRWEKIPGPP
jgi:hypothetical protein